MVKVKDLIKELQKCPNQDAELNFKVNIFNPDEEDFDINDCNIEVWQQDIADTPIYDVMISKKIQTSDDKDSILGLLNEHGKIDISLNVNDKHSNIVIHNGNGAVYRDIKVGGEYSQEVNIVKVLLNNLVGC